MKVNLCGCDLFVSQELLDRPQVRAILKQVRCEAMHQGVSGHSLLDSCRRRRALDPLINRPGRADDGDAGSLPASSIE
jgi:hypothetical protein